MPTAAVPLELQKAIENSETVFAHKNYRVQNAKYAREIGLQQQHMMGAHNNAACQTQQVSGQFLHAHENSCLPFFSIIILPVCSVRHLSLPHSLLHR